MKLSRGTRILTVIGLCVCALLVIRGFRNEQPRVATPATSPHQVQHGEQQYWNWALPEDRLILPKRKVYPYSVIAGGVRSSEELKVIIDRDPEIARHLRDFDVQKAVVVKLIKPRLVYVSYRIGNFIYWTRKRVTLIKGERVITDGTHTIRTRCGNDVSDIPREPTSPSEPTTRELDTPLPDILMVPPPVLADLPPDLPILGEPPVFPLETSPPSYFPPPIFYAPTRGSGIPPSAPVATPEPPSWMLFCLGAAGILAAKAIQRKAQRADGFTGELKACGVRAEDKDRDNPL